jgi:ATP-dependent DNA helicase DinG
VTRGGIGAALRIPRVRARAFARRIAEEAAKTTRVQGFTPDVRARRCYRLEPDGGYVDDLDDLFGAHGPLAQRVAGYAPRREQRLMAAAVEDALRELTHLVVEAGTGTGKTFAYLVPALLSQRRVVISTGTRNLQDQLYSRDLPTVAAAIGRPVRVALLKGRANYLCEHRLALAADGAMTTDPALARVVAWARITRTGDIAEAGGLAEDSPIWSRVTSTADDCLGATCPEYAQCHVVRARRAAQESDIVIVNHHLLLADLALKEEGFGELLPGADAVIVDEAHQIPEIATQFFGIAVTQRQLLGLARDTEAEAMRCGGAGAVAGGTAALVRAAREARLVLGAEPRRVVWSRLGEECRVAFEGLGEALEVLTGDLDALVGASAGLDACRRRAVELSARLESVLGADDEQGLRWVEVFPQSFALHVTPLDAAGSLGAAMASRACAWVFTSATLAVGDDFSHFCGRVGLDDARALRLDSPFDFERNALLCMPEGLPDPAAPDYTRRVLNAAWPLLQASQGRAFLLFTSYRALREAEAELARRDFPFPLLVQGSAPRDELLRRFRDLGNAVLLGTGSFWEGVDVRGPALSLVVIDKLPFASPGDPLLQARLAAVRASGGEPFMELQLPQAVIALKQGVGRLIRDVDDRGVMMLCDPRLRTRAYGSVFFASLPRMRRASSCEEAEDFLRTIVGEQVCQ